MWKQNSNNDKDWDVVEEDAGDEAEEETDDEDENESLFISKSIFNGVNLVLIVSSGNCRFFLFLFIFDDSFNELLLKIDRKFFFSWLWLILLFNLAILLKKIEKQIKFLTSVRSVYYFNDEKGERNIGK